MNSGYPKNCVLFKDEGANGRTIIGPVYVVKNGERQNFKDSARPEIGRSGFQAAWYSKSDAKLIAKKLGLPLVES